MRIGAPTGDAARLAADADGAGDPRDARAAIGLGGFRSTFALARRDRARARRGHDALAAAPAAGRDRGGAERGEVDAGESALRAGAVDYGRRPGYDAGLGRRGR